MTIGLLSDALPYLPSRGGFRLYGGNLLRCLSENHSVHLVSLLREGDEANLSWPQQYCASVRGIRVESHSIGSQAANYLSSFLRARLLHNRAEFNRLVRESISAQKWDVIHIEGAVAAELLDAELPIPKVLNLHDSWTLRCDEMLRCSQTVRERLYYAALKLHEPRRERLLYPRFEHCIVTAERDREEIQRVVPQANVLMIPYGTDTQYFYPVDVPKSAAHLVFHSHLGYAPNVGAALEFGNEIFPRVRERVPGAVFHLIGADPDPKVQELATRPGIKLSANVPDLRPKVCSGEIYVCAIRHGTGLKSKMLEAMAMRMPIVCYPGSIVGIDVVPGVHVLLAETPEEFATHVITLLNDHALADSLAANGQAFVKEHFSWESRARTYERLYQKLIQKRATQALER